MHKENSGLLRDADSKSVNGAGSGADFYYRDGESDGGMGDSAVFYLMPFLAAAITDYLFSCIIDSVRCDRLLL